MKYKVLFLTIIICFYSTLLFAKEPIKIGVLLNITGKMASVDKPALQGMELAVKKLNSEGGVLGREIVLVLYDGKSSKEGVVEAAQLLSKEKDIVAYTGVNGSDYAIAAAPSLTASGKVFLSSGATLQNLPYMYGENMFMVAFGDNTQARALAKFAKRRLNTNVCFIGTDITSEYAKSLSKYFKRRYKKYGGTISKEDWYSKNERINFPLPEKDDKTDLVFVSAFNFDLESYMNLLRSNGYNGPIVSGDSFQMANMEELKEEYAHSIYYSSHIAYDKPSGSVQNFVKEYVNTFKEVPPNSFAALGYDSILLLGQAVARAGSDDPTIVRDKLATTKGFRGVTGEFSYSEGVRVPMKNVDIVSYQNGTASFVEEVSPF